MWLSNGGSGYAGFVSGRQCRFVGFAGREREQRIVRVELTPDRCNMSPIRTATARKAIDALRDLVEPRHVLAFGVMSGEPHQRTFARRVACENRQELGLDRVVGRRDIHGRRPSGFIAGKRRCGARCTAAGSDGRRRAATASAHAERNEHHEQRRHDGGNDGRDRRNGTALQTNAIPPHPDETLIGGGRGA